MNVWRALTAVRNEDPDYFSDHCVKTFALFGTPYSQNVYWAVAQRGYDRRIYLIETDTLGTPGFTPIAVRQSPAMEGNVSCIQRINITWRFRKTGEERKSPTWATHIYGSYAKDQITGIEMPIYISEIEVHGDSSDDGEGDATAAEAGAVRFCD